MCYTAAVTAAALLLLRTVAAFCCCCCCSSCGQPNGVGQRGLEEYVCPPGAPPGSPCSINVPAAASGVHVVLLLCPCYSCAVCYAAALAMSAIFAAIPHEDGYYCKSPTLGDVPPHLELEKVIHLSAS